MPVDALASSDPRSLGARLRRARDAAGRTQEQAAEAIGAARTTMVAMEKGERRVRPEELVALAQLYGRRLSWFLRSSEPVAGLVSQLRWALPSGSPLEPELLPCLHELERLCDDYEELERICDAPLERRDPPHYDIGGVEPEEAAEDVAGAERNRLGLGEGPVPDLREVLESDVGARIFHLDMPAGVAGVFAYTEQHGATVALRRDHAPVERRFFLAHLFGHFLIDRYRPLVVLPDRYERRPAGERFEESFARAFLMPGASVRRRFHDLVRRRARQGDGGRPGQPTAGNVCHLAYFFFVPFETMMRRLEELGLVAAGTWARLHRHRSGLGDARRLPGSHELDPGRGLLPARYRLLAVEAWQRGDLSEGQLASFLRVDRLSARQVVAELGLARHDGDDGAEVVLDLATPLAAGRGT